MVEKPIPQKPSESDWRIERRYNILKNGKKMVYWNWRKKEGHKNSDGQRRVAYRKGGKHERKS